MTLGLRCPHHLSGTPCLNLNIPFQKAKLQQIMSLKPNSVSLFIETSLKAQLLYDLLTVYIT